LTNPPACRGNKNLPTGRPRIKHERLGEGGTQPFVTI
jgi:hypothetical protein